MTLKMKLAGVLLYGSLAGCATQPKNSNHFVVERNDVAAQTIAVLDYCNPTELIERPKICDDAADFTVLSEFEYIGKLVAGYVEKRVEPILVITYINFILSYGKMTPDEKSRYNFLLNFVKNEEEVKKIREIEARVIGSN